MISRRNAIAGAGAAVGVGMATSASALLASDAHASRAALINAVTDILAAHELPDGVFITSDFRTGNIVVHNWKMGFCVSANAIDEGMHRHISVHLKELQKAADQVDGVITNEPFSGHLA